MKDRIHDYLLEEMNLEDHLAFEKAMVKDPALREKANDFREVIEILNLEMAEPAPVKGRKRFLSFLEEEAKKESSNQPPILNPRSVAADFQPWLNLQQMVPPSDLKELFFVPFANNEDGLSAVVWIPGHGMVPEEVHHDCIERFLVLEGSCTISFGGSTYALKEGDVLYVPLHHSHVVRVTSNISCKLIVQRTAA